MAPEQVSDAHVDSRADIYALGITAFQMLNGSPPFDGQPYGQVISTKLQGDGAWLDQLADSISDQSFALLKAMTERDPDQRIGDYEALIREIDQLNNTSLETTNQQIEATQTIPSIAVDLNQDNDAKAAPASFPRRIMLSIAIVGCCAAICFGFFYTNREELPKHRTLVLTHWEQPLFDGETQDGWSRQRGSWESGNDTEGGLVLVGQGSIVRKLPNAKLPKPHPLKNYRFHFGVDLRDAQHVELHFDRIGNGDDNTPRKVVHVSRDGVVFGLKQSAESKLIPKSESMPFPSENRSTSKETNDDSPVYHQVAIERHATYWLVFFKGEFVGNAPIDPRTAADDIQLFVSGEAAHFDDLSVTELIEPE